MGASLLALAKSIYYIFVPLNAILKNRMDTQGNNSLRSRRKKGRGREKSVKEGKGKGEPAIRAGVFVFHPPFSELIQYVTNHK